MCAEQGGSGVPLPSPPLSPLPPPLPSPPILPYLHAGNTLPETSLSDLEISGSIVKRNSSYELVHERKHIFNRLCSVAQENCLLPEQILTLTTKVNEALQTKPITSPSTMKWADVQRILDGQLPQRASAWSIKTSKYIQDIESLLSSKVTRISEMDRIFTMLLCIIEVRQLRGKKYKNKKQK